MNQATDCKRSRIALPVPSTMSLSVGDEVVLGIPQKAFIKASLLTFAMPLIVMLAFALLAQWGGSVCATNRSDCIGWIRLWFVSVTVVQPK